jgi:hypothetical protein
VHIAIPVYPGQLFNRQNKGTRGHIKQTTLPAIIIAIQNLGEQ